MPNSKAKSPSSDLSRDVELLRSSAVAAGIIAAGYFRREFKQWTKENASPVTEADFMVDQFLEQSLMAARPDYGWLSEESTDNPERLGKHRVFIVDPIDGTRAFIKGEDCWTISLAVVEDGEAVAGVVYAPARDELYHAGRGLGAFLNGKRLKQKKKPAAHPKIPAPSAVHQELKARDLFYVPGPNLPSLAYRLVQVAAGRLDGAAARRGSQDWDIAGAAVVLSESGTGFTEVGNEPLRFNKADTRHGALAVFGNETLKEPLYDALLQVYGTPAENSGDGNLERHKP